MFKVRSIYHNRQHNIIGIQCLWRRKLAKRELRRLKKEANEAGALRLAKRKLQKQLEDLTWRLSLEKKIRKPIGIIALQDEACMFPKSTHETFSNKLFQNFRSHRRWEKAKFSETEFTISHYAGKVKYQTETFIDKNRDYVVVEHCNLLASSRCSFITGLFPPLPEESS